MLHTVISLSDVLCPPQERVYETRRTGSGYVTCENTGEGLVVERLFSTDPFDYLRKDLSPGTPYGTGAF